MVWIPWRSCRMRTTTNGGLPAAGGEEEPVTVG